MDALFIHCVDYFSKPALFIMGIFILKKPAFSTILSGIYNEIGENNSVIYSKNQNN